MGRLLAHIPFTSLIDVAEGRDQLDDTAQHHLTICPRCTADFEWLTRTLGVMRADTGESAPAHVLEQAKRLGARLKRPAHRLQALARLMFDSAQAPLAFGIRSSANEQRHLLFETEHYPIDLHVKPQGELWIIAGQLLGAESAGSASLIGSAEASNALNENSEFSLPAVPSGSYTLTLNLESLEITLPEFEIR